MRSDYALYVVAVIFFAITVMSFALELAEFQRNLWIVTTAILGLLFVGLGYSQRPKLRAAMAGTSQSALTPPTPPLTITEAVTEEEKEAKMEIMPASIGLTEVKGIGEKRAEQLKALGISSIEELAKTSANDLAAKLKISAKITEKWIANAKKLAEKP
jgi:predicted flap endonuclease-1-like 5' DNA nuclease